MPIRISNRLRSSLPTEQRGDIEDWLRAKAGGRCFLCDGPINEAADEIQADHDQPGAEQGVTDRQNLNLVHRRCNLFKQNHPSTLVRPFLRFDSFLRALGRPAKYGDLCAHFDFEPRPSQIVSVGSELTARFSDGSETQSLVLNDDGTRRNYRYAYLAVPRVALFNDEECQPRNIKPEHVWSILVDLQRNPLYEAPGCRLLPAPNGLHRLAMFDGQHKTLASWLAGRTHIVVKLFLDLPVNEAVELVNSVQSKIKKLPLSPFEFAAKMADEWASKFQVYEGAVSATEVSESGFVRWLPRAERARGKQALYLARLQEVIAHPELEIKSLVISKRSDRGSLPRITENVLKARAVEKLVSRKLVDAAGQAGEDRRANEAANAVRLLNILFEVALSVGPDDSENDRERARRMLYQSGLEFVVTLCRSAFKHVVRSDDEVAPLQEFVPSEDQWSEISEAIRNIASHPVWTTDFDHSDKMRAIQNALQKNQNADAAFRAVELKLGYALGADEIDSSVLE